MNPIQTWVHCSFCSANYKDEIPLAILDCGHTICSQCALKARHTDNKLLGCAYCKRYVVYKLISPKMDAKIGKRFQEIKKLEWTGSLMEYEQHCNYQANQQNSFLKFEQAEYLKLKKEMQKEMAAYRSEKEHMKKVIAEYRDARSREEKAKEKYNKLVGFVRSVRSGSATTIPISHISSSHSSSDPSSTDDEKRGFSSQNYHDMFDDMRF